MMKLKVMDKNSDRKTILVVLAHPDDETFGMGGTLAMYAHQGVAVHLICATHGEVGEVDAHFLEGFDSIADRRESELRCAGGLLGLETINFLRYRDSGMPGSPDNQHPEALINAPLDQVAGEIIQYMQKFRPQVVLTFDPIGGYRHPDHIAIHNATVKAFQDTREEKANPSELSPYAPQKLYFHVIQHNLIRLAVKLMPLVGRDPRKMGRNQDIDLVSLTEVDFPINAWIDYRPVAKIRDEAAACHASQGGGGALLPGFLNLLRRSIFPIRDGFMRAFPPAVDGVIEKDLFEGVKYE
jgi:LmbE family N-acetylglucosaminyl deacetylase